MKLLNILMITMITTVFANETCKLEQVSRVKLKLNNFKRIDQGGCQFVPVVEEEASLDNQEAVKVGYEFPIQKFHRNTLGGTYGSLFGNVFCLDLMELKRLQDSDNFTITGTVRCKKPSARYKKDNNYLVIEYDRN